MIVPWKQSLRPEKLGRQGPILRIKDVYVRLNYVLLRGMGNESKLMDNEGYTCIADIVEMPLFRDATTATRFPPPLPFIGSPKIIPP